jgi:hypothetical protein
VRRLAVADPLLRLALVFALTDTPERSRYH